MLELTPTPVAALTLSKARIAAALRRSGRSRNIDQVTAELHAILRRPHLRQDPLVEQAMGVQALRLLATLTTERESIEHLSAAVETAFQQHPDYDIITSSPGIAAHACARLLGEIGDDRTRFADARSLNAFAGAAPVTRASGRSLVVTQRRVKTTGSLLSASPRDNRHSTNHPARGPTTTGAGPPATATPLPFATCSAASSPA